MNKPLVWALDHARQQTLGLVADLRPEQSCLQSLPGEHHATWILGHLLLGDIYLMVLLGADQLSEDFPALLGRYGPAAPPQPSPEHYDAPATLVERLTSIGSRRLQAIGRMTVAELEQSTPDPFLVQSQPTIAHHLQSLVCHEGYHAGQLAAWRRAHGLTPARWAFAPPGA
jgi:DinB superfamily